MYTLMLTVRQLCSRLLVVAEKSEPGLATWVRVEETHRPNFKKLPEFPMNLAEMGRYGRILGEAVFRNGIRDVFQRTLARAQEARQSLHVLLSIEADPLRPLRWERLCAPLDGD